MAKRIIAFTIFTFLLFAISTATIASDPVDLNRPDEPAVIERLPESEQPEQTQTFIVPIEPTLPVQFSFRHPINRHSFDRSTRIPLRFVKRHPCRKFKKSFVIPTKRSYGNDMILSDDKTVTVDLETIGDRIPMKWLEFKHRYGHRHHHHDHHDKEEKFEMKKKEHKGGFMRRIRKFLKHTFD